MTWEHRKHDGSYPIVGVNTFRNPRGAQAPAALELIRFQPPVQSARSSFSSRASARSGLPRAARVSKRTRAS